MPTTATAALAADFAAHAGDLPAGPATLMCGHGERTATAASVLERAGRNNLSILDGGVRRLGRRHRAALVPP